jgi:hypothetical protein
MDISIERVARAFYDAEDDGICWDAEPEILKEEFRLFAREAIALLKASNDREVSEAQPIDLAEAA